MSSSLLQGDWRRRTRRGACSSAERVRDVVERLSNYLALVQTVALALRRFEAHVGVGPICTALERAVDLWRRAHAAIGLYLQRTRS
jgi:hypothetical protein